jgi:hypothetical protein|tara:strand:+ start:16 stop:591 length:576 start_codon:yes stop_codon:yes gene_type:complete
MVSTTGQLDAPLVDIGVIQREYWERKTVELPSLAKYQKKSGWKSWFQKTHTPVCVIRRLTNAEWHNINEKFLDLRTELAKNAVLLNKIIGKTMEGEEMTQEEKKVISIAQAKAMPIYIGMLEVMIEEPKMNYAQVEALLDVCDENDKDNLMAQVNTLTSEKMSVAQAVANERMSEVNELRTQMMQEYGLDG